MTDLEKNSPSSDLEEEKLTLELTQWHNGSGTSQETFDLSTWDAARAEESPQK